MAQFPIRVISVLLIVALLTFLLLNGMTAPKNRTQTLQDGSQQLQADSKHDTLIKSQLILRQELNDDKNIKDDKIQDNNNDFESNSVISSKSMKLNQTHMQLNSSKTLDIIPKDMPKNIFPKPAPPLFLSLDNNDLKPEDQLIENLVKPNIYFTWCGKRWFEFRHYLSAVSAIRAIRPDKFLFYYEYYPVLDNNWYNLWIDDLKHDFEFFEMIQMEKLFSDVICRGDRASRINLISSTMSSSGGVYISESTWILEFPAEHRKQDVIMALDEQMDGYMLLKGGVITQDTPLDTVLKQSAENHAKKVMSQWKVSRLSCSLAHHVYQGINSQCVVVKGGNFERIYPMDYCYLENDPFAKIVRKLFYNSEEILKPEPDYSSSVPNIGHMIWIGGGQMDFVFYLSLLSMLYVVKVDVVYIHGDQPPTGHYWAKINGIENIRSRIKLIPRDPPTSVYQGVIEPWYRALMSDIIRVDLMIKYGGVYTDTDAIWVKPLSDEERAYDAVATYDWVDWSYPYPDTVNFGVSYGKRNAPFYRLFRDSMRRLNNDLHGFTGVAMPYKILEKHPGLLRIDRRLGVICYYSRCHPLWEKDYHNMTHDHVVANSIKNWKEDVHAFHWTHPNPTELHNETVLLQSEGIFAEIGKYVLQRAGLL